MQSDPATFNALPQMDDLAELRTLGRLEAESLDLALREQEGREREQLLTNLSLEVQGFAEGGLPDESSGTVWRLHQERERLAAFHRAVISSKGWRLIQGLRRMVGRAW